jgi:hypothetical protein
MKKASVKCEVTAKFVARRGDPEALQKHFGEEYGFRQQSNRRVLQLSGGSKPQI